MHQQNLQPRKYQKHEEKAIFLYPQSENQHLHSKGSSILHLIHLFERKTHMRYYIPLREKMPHAEKRPSALMIPLWIWLGVIALLVLVVLALR